MSEHFDALIVGGGHGGAQAAIALRQNKFEGRVAILTEEADHPYERPPLSKDYFAGQKSFDQIRIRPLAFWAERDIDVRTGTRVVAVDPIGHEVATADGCRFSYGKLIWAGGGHPRKLPVPGGDLPGVFGVRTRQDTDALRQASENAGHVVVIGGGYIGLEAAAVLSKAGKQVTLIETLDRVLARVAGPELSRFYEAEHRSHGVDVRLGEGVAGIEGHERVTGVRLISGELIPADVVVVGIGIVPAVEPLLAADAEGDDGVRVDDYCRTSLPDTYAIGDCAAHVNRFAQGAVCRIESVQNANDMANCVAQHICGGSSPYDAIPWFWSNQYDLRLQTIGLSTGYDLTIMRGRPESRSFSVAYLRRGKLIALDCVNAVKDYVQGRALIAAAATVVPDLLANPQLPLKSVLQTPDPSARL